MKNFNDIKGIWTENEPGPFISAQSLSKRKKGQLSFLQKKYSLSATGLIGFTMFVLGFTFFRDSGFIYELSYIALFLIAGCSLIMVLINLHNIFLLSKIHETLAPKEYLTRWSLFYTYRLRFFRFYSPALFLILCFSFSLYLPEILGYYPTAYYKAGFVLFIIIVFLGYRMLGKRSILEEKMRLNELNNTIRMLFED